MCVCTYVSVLVCIYNMYVRIYVCMYEQTYVCVYIYVCMFCIYIYTECPRRNLPGFGMVFLMLNYTDITQNTCVQSFTVTEIMAREF